MMTFENINLIKIMPGFLKNDEFVKALCLVFNPVFKEIDTEIRSFLIVNQLERLDDYDLDLLAVELNITWYNTSDSIDTKRKVIESGIQVNQIKGTVAAVENAVKAVFGDGRVEEWYDYGADPGHFRVVTNNSSATDEMSNRFLQIVEQVKRKSAHLDQIIVELASEMRLNFSLVLHLGEKITFRQVV